MAPARVLFAALALLCAAPAAAQAADVDFAPVELGTTPDVQEMALTNDGDESFDVGLPSITGPDADEFSFVYEYCQNHPLDPGEDCDMAVQFDPLRIGTASATIEIPIAGEPEPVRISLSGEGKPSLKVTPAVLAFGQLEWMAAPRTLDVSVQNVTDEELSALRAVRAYGFTIVAKTCGSTLAPGATCTYSIAFTGRLVRSYDEQLRIVSGSRTLATVQLTGTRLLNRITVPRPKPQPKPPTPSAAAALHTKLTATVKRWRHTSRRGLRRGGFVLTGFKAPVDGQLELFVVGKRQVALGSVEVRAGKPARLRARLLPAGRHLLKAHRNLHWRAVLKFVAQADGRVSRTSAALSLPAK